MNIPDNEWRLLLAFARRTMHGTLDPDPESDLLQRQLAASALAAAVERIERERVAAAAEAAVRP